MGYMLNMGIISFTFHIPGNWENMVKQLVWSWTANNSVRARTRALSFWGPIVVLSAFPHSVRVSDTQWRFHSLGTNSKPLVYYLMEIK